LINGIIFKSQSAYFGLEHNVSQDGSFVIASKSEVAKIPPVEFSAYIKNDNFTEPTPVRSHSIVPRGRRRSQNYDNLSCAMSALSFQDARNNYSAMRYNEQPPYWLPQFTPFVFNPAAMQNQNFGYYPNAQVNTSVSSFVPMPYSNLSPQPNQPLNSPFQVPPPPYDFQSNFNNPAPKNVQTSP